MHWPALKRQQLIPFRRACLLPQARILPGLVPRFTWIRLPQAFFRRDLSSRRSYTLQNTQKSGRRYIANCFGLISGFPKSKAPNKMSIRDPSDGKQWGVLLEYLNPDTEAQFLKNFSACSFKYDVANHVIMISLGCAFSFIMTMINGATLGVNLFLVCISVTALRLYFILKRKDIYVKNRTVILMFSQTMHALLATLSSSYMPMPDYTRLSFLVMYLMRTPILILNMVGIGLSVPIKAHVFSSLFACLASSVWILPFCSRCQNVDHAYPTTVSQTFFPDLSRTITEWLHRSTVIGALVDATNSGTPRPAPTLAGSPCCSCT
ncbi:hypothetical protein BSKO_05506 [Bryopsis sp. KO-2023]|nr:hypothetical protein BSKO_05506 [Bryopsis sp. KO-2023]